MSIETYSVRLRDRLGHLSNAISMQFDIRPLAVPKPIMGASAADNTKFNTLNTATGNKLSCRRIYNSGIPASYTLGTSQIVIWSWKPNPATFPTDTAAQNALRTFLQSYPTNGPGLVVIAYHEPEDNINAGTFTLAQWKALQNKVGEIIRDLNRSNIKFAICLMGPWTFDTRSAYDAWDWIGGINWDDIDEIHIDAYRWNPGDPSMEQILTVNNSGTGGGGSAPSVISYIQGRGKIWGLSEWGCTETNVTQASKAAWITQNYNWLKTRTDFRLAAYFNNNLDVTSGADARATWELHDEALTAFVDVVEDSKL